MFIYVNSTWKGLLSSNDNQRAFTITFVLIMSRQLHIKLHFKNSYYQQYRLEKGLVQCHEAKAITYQI